MKALILAAGLGSRLKNNTKIVPKALVNVNGIPIIEYQVNALKNNGIFDIIIVIGKLGNKIIDYFKNNHPELTITFVENKIYDQSNSSYSFWLAREHLNKSEYIHLNCDIIFSTNLLKNIIEDKRPNIIAVRTNLSLNKDMENVVIGSNNKITKMGKNIFQISHGKAFGLAKLSATSTKEICKKIEFYLNKNDKNQHCYGMIRELVDSLEYFAFNANNNFLLEINTEDDLKSANHLLANNELK